MKNDEKALILSRVWEGLSSLGDWKYPVLQTLWLPVVSGFFRIQGEQQQDYTSHNDPFLFLYGDWKKMPHQQFFVSKTTRDTGSLTPLVIYDEVTQLFVQERLKRGHTDLFRGDQADFVWAHMQYGHDEPQARRMWADIFAKAAIQLAAEGEHHCFDHPLVKERLTQYGYVYHLADVAVMSVQHPDDQVLQDVLKAALVKAQAKWQMNQLTGTQAAEMLATVIILRAHGKL